MCAQNPEESIKQPILRGFGIFRIPLSPFFSFSFVFCSLFVAVMQSQENAISKPVKPNVPKQQSSSRSTNKIILDYLLYLSIQSRLKQARVELLELSTPFPDTDHPESIEARKKRWIETANKAEQDKNAVEAIVAGNNNHHPVEIDNDIHSCCWGKAFYRQEPRHLLLSRPTVNSSNVSIYAN